MKIDRSIAQRVLQTVDAGLISGVGKPIPGKMCVEAAVCYALGLPHCDEPGCVARALRLFKIKLNDAQWSSPAARAIGLRRLALAQLGSAGHLDDLEFARHLAELTVRVSVPVALRAAASIEKDPKYKTMLLSHAATCEREGTRQAALDAKADATIAANAAAAAAAAAATYATTYAANASAAATYTANASAAATYTANAAANAAATYAATAAASAAATTYAATASAAATYAANAAANAAAAAAAAAAATYAATAATYAANAAATYAQDKVFSDFAEAVVQLLIKMKVPGCQWLDLVPLDPA